MYTHRNTVTYKYTFKLHANAYIYKHTDMHAHIHKHTVHKQLREAFT